MKVGVVGLGYVGLPLAVAFAEEGNEVVGLDADPRKIDALGEGTSYIEDVSSDRLAALDGRLTATSRYADLTSCDAVIICVPTPLTNSREPDLSYMIDAATSLAAVMQKGQLVVLESTTYPGTTRERLRPILEESGLAAGRDFHLAFSPERIDPGPGMGGHCLPVDPFYLSYKAREHDFYTEFIELAGKINQNQPQWCVRRIERALNSVEKATNGSKVLLLGVSYKAGVGDIRESPALKIINLLRSLGADVSYHDPHVPDLADFELSSVPLEDSMAAADLVCILTAHPHLDYQQVVEDSSLVLDFRGVTRGISSEKLVRL
jgi:UDP-N-acetyl-D-mannosaminuronate dehydrogenase